MSTKDEGGNKRKWKPGVYQAIANCLIFFNTCEEHDDETFSWFWLSKLSGMCAHVVPDVQKKTIRISVRDVRTELEIVLWTTEVVMPDSWRHDYKWRRELRQAGGEAIVLAQRRPKCPLCRSEMLVRALDIKRQEFSCANAPKCNGRIGIVDHDIERNEAACTREHAVAAA